MRRLMCLCAAGLLAAVLVGCDAKTGGPGLPTSDSPASRGAPAKAEVKDKDRGTADKASVEMKDKDKGAVASDKDKAWVKRVEDSRDLPPPPVPEPPAPVPVKQQARPRPTPDLPAGVLTAGSFDDNFYPGFFRSFAGRAGQNPYLGNVSSRLLGRPLEIHVKNAQGAPVGGARVGFSVPGAPAVELITRSDGRAVYLSSWDRPNAQGDVDVTAGMPGEGQAAKVRVPKDATDFTLVLPTASAALPHNLDLTFVLDTTGSMGDELEYLKSEIKNIAAGVRARFPEVKQRYALVVYRDENMGDEYTTRVFDFTTNLDEFQRNLAAQSAAGGGDLPEAMQRGLDEATRLRWRDAPDTAHLLFLIADAPPHARDAGRTLDLVDVLRKKGVAVYGVAASCEDATATEANEFIMRAAAMLTGAQYLFLTDDSAVGEAHGEPHLPFYRVEKLNRLMTRMIAGELSGRRTEPDPTDVLRTVGTPPRQGRPD